MTKIECMTPHPNRKDIFKDYIIDYSLDAPFEGWPEDVVHACLDETLNCSKINIEIASLILSHLKDTNGDYLRANNNISEAGIKPIRWLKGVTTRVLNLEKSFKPQITRPRNCKVYFILLTEDRVTPLPWGLYIGQTIKKIEDRYAIHMDDNNSKHSKKVNNRGWQILYSISSQVPAMARADVLRFEKMALDSLRGILKSKHIRGLKPKYVKGG
jgi:hypothetical protein